MKSSKRLVGIIAKKYKKDSDEFILFLWSINEPKFGYLKNQHTTIRDNDVKYIKKLFDKSRKIENHIDENILVVKNKKRVLREFNFESIGAVVDPIMHISYDEILRIHDALVMDFSNAGDPIFPAGVKSESLLHSALFHPQTSYAGAKKYPTIESGGAALMYAISNNHPFHNGNKRTALVALLVFLDRHNIFLTCNEDDLFSISIKVASHKLTYEEKAYNDEEIYKLAIWIFQNSKVIRKDLYPITLRKLKQILNHFDCNILDNGRVTRVKKERNFLGIFINKELKSMIPSAGDIADGKEVSIKTVKKIRKDLCLDAENGIDSADFYQAINNPTVISNEFIVKYKNLLRRLSKL